MPMNATLDTNVLMSGIFFGGVPGRVLEAWRDARFKWFVTSDIIDEYREVSERLHLKIPRIDPREWIALIEDEATRVVPERLKEPVCEDPDDDKFVECALASNATIVSGDHHLLDANGQRGICVKKPREFLNDLSPDIGRE